MRIVFMGTPDISRCCLQRVVEDGNNVVGVYTKPDTPKNRGMKMAMSEVKEYAQSVGLPVFQPTTFKDDAVMNQLRDLKPDLILVVAYGKILPQRVLDVPTVACVNIHASILPDLRGSAPFQWAILNGLDETGLTAMYMSAEMDAGDMIEVRKTPIDPMETSEELLARLAEIGAGLLADTVKHFKNGTVNREVQDHSKATFAPMLTKEDAPIKWEGTARNVVDQVRGLIPWPVATSVFADTQFKIWRAEYSDKTSDVAPGTPIALTKKGLEVVCGDGK
ncbi:MAG: methionyl-tRNA formyltransferase, partial [Eubacteriales bacterium]